MTRETFSYLPRLTRGDLPPWFYRPTGVSGRRGSLFRNEATRVAAAGRVRVDDLGARCGKGWPGFDTAPGQGRLEEPHELDEIQVLRDRAGSGPSDAQIEALPGDLPRPFAPDPQRLACSFSFGWVEGAPPPDPFETLDEPVDGWLCDLVAEGQIDRILDLLDSRRPALTRAFSGLQGASEDDERGETE